MRGELQFALRAARDLPPEELPRLLGEIEEVRCTAMARLAAPVPVQSLGADELLSVRKRAVVSGSAKTTFTGMERHFQFTRRMGRKLLFSGLGIEKYIKQQEDLTGKRHNGMLSRP